MSADRAPRLRRGVATGAGVAVGATAYLLTLLNYGTDLTRTAMGIGYASNFFDLQARAFMDGRLSVPPGSLGIEGFVIDGREYMYFPPFPALLRLPVLFTTDEFDGRLTVLSMALAFVLMAVMTSRLVWLVRDLMNAQHPHARRDVTRLEAVSMALLIALATGGTTLTFDAADPWAYHEVYAWSIPLVVGSMYWMLRVLQRPDRASIGWLGGFAVATILTRTTGGWAVCLVTVGIGLWLLSGRVGTGPRRTGWWVIAAGLGALAVGIAYNWAKFRHPYLFPLEDQVWTSLNERRQEALEVNGGTITGPQFFTTSLTAYFRPDGIRFVDYFPWVTLPAAPPVGIDGAFVDQSYRTGSVTAFMPWLLLLTVAAVPLLFRPGVDAARRWLRAPLIAGVLVTAGVMAYGYLANRYTSEFVPALVLGAAVSTAALNRWLALWPRLFAVALVPLTAIVIAGIGAQMLVGFAEAAYTARGPALQRYVALQERFSPGAQADLVTASEGRPSGGTTDDLVVRGDCDAVYINTGDTSQPWIPVEHRSIVWDITISSNAPPTDVRLGRIGTDEPGYLWLTTDTRGRARFVLETDELVSTGYWFDILPPGEVRLGVRDNSDLGYAQVSSTPGGFVGFLRSFDYDESWIGSSVDIIPLPQPERRLAKAGITIDVERGLDTSVCGRLGR